MLNAQTGRCSVYDGWRPKACAAYRCALLVNYATGKLPYEEALAHISATRELADKVRSTMPDFVGVTSPEFAHKLAAGKPGGKEGHKPLAAEVELDAATLLNLLQKILPDR